MSNKPEEIIELLIPSLTPQNLERGDLWFQENSNSIKKAIRTHAWWRENAIIIERDKELKPSVLARKLLELGYERSPHTLGRGIFSPRGGIIEVWPIQSEKPLLVEFHGNTISTIRVSEERQEAIKPHIPATSLEKLLPGSFVVHVDHGIGIYRGTKGAIPLEQKNERSYFVVEYASPRPGAEPDRLFVPVNQKDRLSPYVGFETPKIHRLGGTLWYTTKKKAKEDVEKLAHELLALYAKRHQALRPPYTGDYSLETEIKETFVFGEKEDQLRAEEEILGDLSRPKPMDRVLCGDVGFGKTELALRAAVRAAISGKQVALLSPTTILASQHEKTFAERLKKFPFRIAMLSRLTPAKEEKNILEDLKNGVIDIAIGTHRLLSKDIIFKDLGLVIVDEEQRFGVKQKERFKDLRTEIDILSLSATPIPRTLSLALAKLRNISFLSTPPPERLPITTLVLPYSKKLIKKAIEQELDRGGQIYFLHNRIETIGSIKEKLRQLKTKKTLRIEVIHGRMPERQILRSMETFRERKCDVLLATTIIENGLDISSANTLIVDDAVRLGLAEAHQLRGRIGRGSVQAHAYFLYKPRHLTEKSLERLQALQEYSELGAGYQIALRDLEIRGAGNILGKEQSGAINKVGLNLYCQMLAEAVEAQRR